MLRLSLVVGSVIALAGLPGVSPAQGTGCDAPRPDSLATVVPPIYRECDVTRAAQRRGAEPTLDLKGLDVETLMAMPCSVAEFEFVVDSTGSPEPATVMLLSPEITPWTVVVSKTLAKLRYRPAEIDKRPVRQVVRYRREAERPQRIAVRAAPGSAPWPGGGGRAPPPSPPNC